MTQLLLRGPGDRLQANYEFESLFHLGGRKWIARQPAGARHDEFGNNGLGGREESADGQLLIAFGAGGNSSTSRSL